MGSIKYFIRFFKESVSDFKTHFGLYLPTYIGFLIVSITGCIPWTALGFPDKSIQEVVVSLIVGLLSLILVTNVILIEKSRVKNRERERLLYSAPTYLIYTLYSTLIIVAFLALAVFLPAYQQGIMQREAISSSMINLATYFLVAIPAIVAALFVAMVPLASVLIDNDRVNYFQLSFKMAKKSPLLVLLFGASSLLIETPALLIDLLGEQWMSRLAFGVGYSFVDSFIIIVLTKTSVSIFYHLKNLTVGESVY